jgi:uncharacterized protein (DUF362 family)
MSGKKIVKAITMENSAENRTAGSITRRRFIRDLTAGTAGMALASALPDLIWGQKSSSRDVSRVIIARHPGSVIGPYSFDQSIVGELLHRAIAELTGEQAPGMAWAQFFPDLSASSVIGIKINCINRYTHSHPAVVQAVVEGLASMRSGREAFSRNHIIIWDRRQSEMSHAGFAQYSGSDPDRARCMATEQSVGYDEDLNLDVNGHIVNPSRILTEECDYIVNLPVLNNHTGAGLTLGMKNHLGSVHDPEDLHYIDPELAELNRIIRDDLGNRDRIVIIDALVGVNTSGPNGPPQSAYGGLILGTDLVAVDCVGRDVLADNGWSDSPYPGYIDIAAGAPYHLGTNDPDQMDVFVRHPIPAATREHVDQMIRFHREGLATALQVEWAINRYARGL